MSSYHVWGGGKGQYCKRCQLQRRVRHGQKVYFVLNDPETVSIVAGPCAAPGDAKRDRETRQPRPSVARIVEPANHERLHVSCRCRVDLWQYVRDESARLQCTQSVFLEVLLKHCVDQKLVVSQDDVYTYGRKRYV